MVPKKVKQEIVLEEVSPIAAIPEEVDKSLEEFKKVVHGELMEVFSLMEDNHHHVMFILYDFENPLLHNKSAPDHNIQCFLY